VTLIPAIDLLDGACVRLTRGSYDAVERYGEDPVQVARRFEAAGARWIHLVDLDAARAPAVPESSAPGSDRSATRGRNRQTIQRIARALSCAVETGGGIRSRRDVVELLDAGVKRLILGTAVVNDPDEVSRWCSLRPGTLWAGIDADRGVVKISGWERSAEMRDAELARRVKRIGLAGIVYTSIGRDGTLEGPDIERSNRIAEISGLPVILSGGIGSMEDVRRVAEQRHPGVVGLIIGKAIYRGRVDLGELFQLDA
jgi:phosphoribosylformimino-5-aminoimidazole carboxamide ribotide isomerase